MRSEDLLGLVLVVPSASERDVFHGGGPAFGVGVHVMELEEGALRAPVPAR